MKKKILFVITKSNFGGAQRYVYDMATSLPSVRYDVAVLLGGEGLLTERLKESGIRVISVPSLMRDISLRNDLKSFFAFLTIFRRERPDIIHVNSAKAGGMGALAGRLTGVPTIIFTAHGWAFNEDRPYIGKLLITFFSFLTIFLSHHTIAVSEAMTTSVPRFLKRKIQVIKNSIGSIDFLPRIDARDELRGLTAVPDDNLPWIGTLAELHHIKGLSYAVSAMNRLHTENRAFHYFVLGEGDERAALEKQTHDLKLEDRIHFVGFVPDARCLLAAFDIFLLPSLSEALAYVLLEAGSAGLPVVASNTGGIPEIIEDGRTGLLVPPRSPEAIVSSIARLLDDSNFARTLGTTLQAKVSGEFSLTQMVAKTEEVYRL